MSSTPSPESNGTSFLDSNIPRPSEDTDMQSVPEITIYNPAGVEISVNSPNPFVQRQQESFLQRRAIERAENPDLVEPRSDRATNTTVNSADLSTLGRLSQRRQRPGNSAFRAIARDPDILSLDGTIDLRLPMLAEEVQAVATPGLDSSSRVREIRRVRRLRRLDQSRRRDITRSLRERRNAMDALSGRPASSILNRPSFNPSRSMSNRTNNRDADDEAVDMDPPLSDPATNLDTFSAEHEYEQQEICGMTTDLSYDFATLPGRLQPRGYENPTDQRRRSALHTFTTPVNADSPSVASTSTSTSSSTTEPQTRSQATGTGNTTVSSRKLSQGATVRLWVAMYQTNDQKQQDLETMREEGVDGIPISKLSIGGASQG